MADTNTPNETPTSGTWTIMVYNGSDDNLSPLFLDQLKAIKDAGFAQRVKVLIYFDPNEAGVPSRIFNVNSKRKAQHPGIHSKSGDAKDPFVRDMFEDLADDIPPKIEKKMIEGRTDTAGAKESLELFLDYCLMRHPADHYMLYLSGHGLVVGNDAFLPDDNPVSAITLVELGQILNHRFGRGKSPLELLGLQSCAMNAIEVLYELRGTAKYLIGSEGLSFVMGWQYRQLFKKIFNALEDNDSLERLVESLYWLTFFGGKDFLLAGYPLELALCRLDKAKVEELTEPIKQLVIRLTEALRYDEGQDAIQLAHLKAQSFFDEIYTDLYDFCLCLQPRCTTRKLKKLGKACAQVMKTLKPIPSAKNKILQRFGALVIHSSHFGWSNQYSHGLSIYFPWSAPIVRDKSILKHYEKYAFTGALKIGGDHSWLSFLQEYFKKTKRLSRQQEDKVDRRPIAFMNSLVGPDLIDIDFAGDAHFLIGALEKPTGGSGKPTGGSDKPTAGSGASCDCPSIKNYPRDVV